MFTRAKPDLTPRVPYPLGYAEATTSSLTVAAPLLAGAALSLVGVIIVEGKHFRNADLTLLLVVAAAIALIASIQIGADARRYLYNEETIKDWYGDRAKDSKAWTERVTHFGKWATRTRAAVIAFNTGTMLLILAVTTSLIPRDNHAVARWVAVGLALSGAVVELWWIRRLFKEETTEEMEKPTSPDGGTN